MRTACPVVVSGQNISTSPVGGDFVQGFVSAGVLAAAVNGGFRPTTDKRTLRLALQGGTALAAGKVAAQAWQQRNLRQALIAVAAGWVGVSVIENLLQDSTNQEQTP